MDDEGELFRIDLIFNFLSYCQVTNCCAYKRRTPTNGDNFTSKMRLFFIIILGLLVGSSNANTFYRYPLNLHPSYNLFRTNDNLYNLQREPVLNARQLAISTWTVVYSTFVSFLGFI